MKKPASRTTRSVGDVHGRTETGKAAAPAVAMWELAYDRLKRRIMSNELPAGREIDDEAIAAELGISRTPVREAILRLRNEGFVEVLPRRSSRVVPISLHDMREMYELLTALEVFAVELLAARKPDESELAPLRKAVADMTDALGTGDPVAWIAPDERFHRGLLVLSGNSRIAEVGLAFRDRVLRAHVIALRLRPQPPQSAQAHRELVDLIAAGCTAEARACHLAQRLRAGRELLDSVERAGIMVL